MAQIKISKSFVNSIANKGNYEYVDNINKKIIDLFSSSIELLSKEISYVSIDNVVLQPANELLTDAMIDNSSFTYFLGINNAQLEMNTTNKIKLWDKFKNALKYFWNNRKFFKKRKKKKRKKKDENAIPEKEFSFDPMKYNIYNLTQDLQDTLIKFLPETVVVYAKNNLLQIIGKEEFGSNTLINVYVVNYDGNIFKYYVGKKNKKFIDVDFESRISLINSKVDLTNENFIKMIKVLNAIYYNVNKVFPNQVFIESILASCPNEFFDGEDIYNVFIKIINHLSIKPIAEIKSINNPNKTILKDEVCGNNVYGFSKMMNSIIDIDKNV